MQELLRVAARLELDLGVTGEVLCLRNLITLEESGVSLELDDHVVALVTLLDLAQMPASTASPLLMRQMESQSFST